MQNENIHLLVQQAYETTPQKKTFDTQHKHF